MQKKFFIFLILFSMFSLGILLFFFDPLINYYSLDFLFDLYIFVPREYDMLNMFDFDKLKTKIWFYQAFC